MRQKFPEGRGGPFDVPGVGRVIEGEEFDYPDLVAGCVSLEPAGDEGTQGADGTAGTPAGDDESGGGEDEGADSRTEAQGRSRAKGNRP